MTTHRVHRVTQDGMVESQPGVSVSYSIPAYRFTKDGVEPIPGKVGLNVCRHYPGLVDPKTGFRLKIKRCDADGMLFDTQEQAEAEAIRRGYLMVFYRKAHNLHKGVATKV